MYVYANIISAIDWSRKHASPVQCKDGRGARGLTGVFDGLTLYAYGKETSKRVRNKNRGNTLVSSRKKF